MECSYCEDRLSDYIEQALPTDDMGRVSEHVRQCPHCSVLVEEIRSVVATCNGFPRLEPDVELLERILLRTSGRPRSRSFQELIEQYFLRPLFTPRFAVGAVLTALFVVLLANFMAPKVSAVASFLAPRELLVHLDRGVQQLYSEGLKAYDRKNELQAQFTFYKNNVLNKLGFMIEQLDVPVEGKRKPPEPRQQQNNKGPTEKSSVYLLPA